MKNKKKYDISFGNVFSDLGISNAEEMLAKAELVRQINNLIKQKKLTQAVAARLLGVDQPKISALNKGKLTGFSLERLFRFLTILGQTITIKVMKSSSKSKKKLNVSVNFSKLKKMPIIKSSNFFSNAVYARKKDLN